MYKGVTPVADWAFVKQLKEYDSKLSIVFDRGVERFIVCRQRAYGKPWGVLVIQTDDGAFRQPDGRDIKRLYEADLWKNGGVDARIRRGEKTMWEHEDKLEADSKEHFRALSRENKIQLMNTYRKATNTGSKAPEFRRIEDIRKPGALTLSQIRAARAAGRDPWVKAA
jgi:hypothetical protein